MNIRLPQLYFSKLLRAVVEFDMIKNGDSILIGVSGGKDSIFLSYAMAVLRERLHKDFQLHALTINPMFTDTATGQPAPFDTERIRTFMQSIMQRSLSDISEMRSFSLPANTIYRPKRRTTSRWTLPT